MRITGTASVFLLLVSPPFRKAVEGQADLAVEEDCDRLNLGSGQPETVLSILPDKAILPIFRSRPETYGMKLVRFDLRSFTIVLWLTSSTAGTAIAQGFGVELHNTLMPASGAMGGASIARPQDIQSAIGGNPATLANCFGTQFSTNSAWLEATFNMQHTGTDVLPGVSPFSAKSDAQGSALGGFGVTQDLRALGLPVTVGMGLLGTAGAGLSFKQVPQSNGTSDVLSVLTIATGFGAHLTDRLAVGASMWLGTANMYGPFIGTSAAAYDYALRGSAGLTYDLAPATTVGVYYQSKQSFNFDNAIRFQLLDGTFTLFQDIPMDLPRNVGVGIANQSLMQGRLLLAFDLLYKNWNDTNLFGPLYNDQWAYQFGTQYALTDRIRLRFGYVYADNITETNPGPTIDGNVLPGLQNAVQYVQAQFPAINRHRISGGVGIRDVLPGLDTDLFAGGMFRESQDFGEFTSSNLQTYWIGLGITWRFGRGHCHPLPVANDWF